MGWLRRLLVGFFCVLYASVAWSQFSTVGNFNSSSVDTGWTLSGSAFLTAPSIDASGSGWLRLTGNANNDQGQALYTGGSFSALTGLRISFNYVSWTGGSPGADGIAVFLYDATQNMAGAILGGGLGYCKGAGAYLGIAMDEYGNFSNGGDRCTGGGGPGRVPQTLSIRGPSTSSNPFITNTLVPGNIDNPANVTRPTLNQVVVTLVPSSTVGYIISVDFRNGPGGALVNLVSNVNFPYTAPAALSVGIAASTGGSKNIHEINSLVVSGNAPPQPTVNKSFNPPIMSTGGTSTLVLNLNSTNNSVATLTALFRDTFPAGVTTANPSGLSTTCPGAATASVGSNSVTYANGATVPAVGCSIAVNITSSTLGTVTNTVAAGALQTTLGSNATPATATLVVTPIAAPTVSKTFSPTTALAGKTSTLVVTLGNSNSRPATLASTFTDTLPAGLRIAAPPALGGTCSLASVTANAGSSTVAYASGATQPAGGCTISVSVTGSATGTYTNTLAVGVLQTTWGSNAAGATATLTVTPAALLSVSKTNGLSSVVAGSTTSYTIVVSNGGPSDASNTVLQDVPSTGLDCLNGTLTCSATGGAQCPGSLSLANLLGAGLSIPQLPNGGSATFTLQCNVTATGQ